MKKVLFVLMNRANYARSKSSIEAVAKHPELELQVIAGSGMLLERFGKSVKVVKADGFKIDEELYMSIEGENPQTMAQSVGLGLLQLAPAITRLNPDVVVTIADRYETLATAIAATYMNKILVHIQGGELTGTIDESVRHAITKMAHLHFASTEESRSRIVSMGENPDFVFNTGCPAMDLAKNADKSINRLKEIKIGGLGNVDLTKPYLLVMQHPVTTEFGQGYHQITETLKALKELKIQTLMLWPNPDAGSDDMSKAIRIFREQNHVDFPIQFFKNVDPEDYITLMANAACLVGNSSSFIREGSFLGIPAVIVGTRQQNREHGENAIYSNYESADIVDRCRLQLNHGKFKPDYTYGNGDAGEQIADLISQINPPVQKIFCDSPKLSVVFENKEKVSN